MAESRHPRLVRRIKVLAGLVPYKTDEPQDGRFAIETPASVVDVRVSVVPTRHGERVGLRSLLRQDPNVLMVGEIRDPETAEIAVQAGLTGHLILTSLHAESTAGVFARLIDTGIEPFLAASAVTACVAQRLVRRLCPDCRRPVKAGREAMARLAELGVAAGDLTFYRGEGCRACERSGVRGRTAIFEMLRMTPDLRRLAASGVPTPEIEAAAIERGMKPLAEAAVERAAAGQISLDEAIEITGGPA